MREECCTSMLYDEIALARFMVYAQSIEDSKIKRISRNLKKSGSSDKGQTRFKKRGQGQEQPKSRKVKYEK